MSRLFRTACRRYRWVGIDCINIRVIRLLSMFSATVLNSTKTSFQWTKMNLFFFFFNVEFVLLLVSKSCRLLTCTFVQWAEFHARCMMANNHKQDHSFATVALLLFVETPSLLYPNMSCHRSHIEDSGPCLNVYNNSLKWIGKKREKRKRDSQTVSQTFEVFKGKPHHQSSTQI